MQITLPKFIIMGVNDDGTESEVLLWPDHDSQAGIAQAIAICDQTGRKFDDFHAMPVTPPMDGLKRWLALFRARRAAKTSDMFRLLLDHYELLANNFGLDKQAEADRLLKRIADRLRERKRQLRKAKRAGIPITSNGK